MKKSKKILLLRFMQFGERVENERVSLTYDQLYESVPFAKSSIRGIVCEFETLGYLRRLRQEKSSWQLTGLGESIAIECFPSFNEPTGESEIILSIGQSGQTQKQITSRSLQIDKQAFLYFEPLRQSEIRKFGAFLRVDATQIGFSDFLFQSKMGKRSWKFRQNIVHLFKQLRVKQRTYSHTSQTIRRYRENILTEIISAKTELSVIPEKYYPKEMRLNTFLTEIW